MSSSSTVVPLRKQESLEAPLTAVLRSGARRLLAEAIEAEADAFLAEMKALRLPDGRERIVRHGHGPERLVPPALGPADAEPGCATADPVSARGLDGPLPGGSRRPAG